MIKAKTLNRNSGEEMLVVNRSFKPFVKRALVIALSSLVFSCGGESDIATQEAEAIADIFQRDRARVLDQLATEVIPDGFQALVDQTGLLIEDAQEFCTTPSEALLGNIRSQWKQVKSAHAYTEAMSFGEPVNALDGSGNQTRARRLYIREVSESQMIDRLDTLFANSETITETTVSGANITIQGLQALEYVLFEDDVLAENFMDSEENIQRCNYLISASQNIDTIANLILNAWSPSGDNFAQELISAGDGSSIYADRETALDDVFSVLNSLIQVMRDDKLNALIESEDSSDAESWRSENSLNNFQNNLDGIYAVYTGSNLSGEDGYGADDFYRVTTEEAIGEQNIQIHFDDVRSGIEVVFEPFSQAVNNDFGLIRLGLLHGYTVTLAEDIETRIFTTLTGSSADFNFNDGD